MENQEFTLEIISDPDNLHIVDDFIREATTTLVLEEDRFYGILLCVSEATTNAIIHANKKDLSKTVKIKVTISKSKLIITIKDQGKGFDPNKIPDPTSPENILKDSGRGLYLMKIYTSELVYNLSDEGTETVLVFSL